MDEVMLSALVREVTGTKQVIQGVRENILTILPLPTVLAAPLMKK